MQRSRNGAPARRPQQTQPQEAPLYSHVSVMLRCGREVVLQNVRLERTVAPLTQSTVLVELVFREESSRREHRFPHDAVAYLNLDPSRLV